MQTNATIGPVPHLTLRFDDLQALFPVFGPMSCAFSLWTLNRGRVYRARCRSVVTTVIIYIYLVSMYGSTWTDQLLFPKEPYRIIAYHKVMRDMNYWMGIGCLILPAPEER